MNSKAVFASGWPVAKPKRKADEGRPPAAKSPRGRPPERVVKLDDTPRNVARSFFGMPSTKFTRKKEDAESSIL